MFSNFDITLHNISTCSLPAGIPNTSCVWCPGVVTNKGHECFKVPSIYDKLVCKKDTFSLYFHPHEATLPQSAYGRSPLPTNPALMGIHLASWGGITHISLMYTHKCDCENTYYMAIFCFLCVHKYQYRRSLARHHSPTTFEQTTVWNISSITSTSPHKLID